jgi:bifunctional UDP-N-acetylglucosamine pyrophosphorylase/glucosamine-1-phosphate N-acetyltransferase
VESTIGSDVSVGPFANLRPGTRLEDRVKIGDFVETKNAAFGPGAQASHLSYIGDAQIGAGTNIGAGTITCNYDGYRKHRTVIGRNAFIGSHSTLVAPVTIGDGAFIAAGSAITVNVPTDAMAIARSRPTLKEGWAANYRAERGASKQSAGRSAKAETRE